MLSDEPYAAQLTLADRLRLMSDEMPLGSLEYRTLHAAADLIESVVERNAGGEPPES
jgi:hypothetical protein